MEEAREILKEEISDYQFFRQTSLEAWNLQTVKESYKKDPDLLLQFADRLYAREILEAPDPTLAKAARRIVLGLLRRVSRLRFI